MTHGSLFSGIGGFDLAAEWMGWTNLFNCEWEEFPRKVLKHHFPNAKQYGDIKEFNATDYARRIDILSGGFPCQPYSVAGKRKGKEDERHLWPEMLRVIRECSPRWIVGENVRGLVNWSEGLVFEEVCADLEACGYSVQPFILPAAAVNAPHRRDRVWFVAYANDKGRGYGHGQVQSTDGEVRQRNNDSQSCDASSAAAPNPNSGRRNAGDKCEHDHNGEREVCKDEPNDRNEIWSKSGSSSLHRNAPDTDSARTRQNNDWENFPTVPPVCGGNDGLPKELDGITFSKWRRESIKAYGNAIVPQVAYQIFKAIEEYDNR